MNSTDYTLHTNTIDLTELELTFKALHTKYPSKHLDIAQNISRVKDVLTEAAYSSNDLLPIMLQESLIEEKFFTENLDVSIYKHIRYMPTMYHKHHFFEVIYVLKGSCTNYIMNESVPMSSGDICIFPPNTEHAISCFNDESEVINILIRKSTFENSFSGVLSEKDILSDFFIYTLYHSNKMPFLLFKTGDDPTLVNYIHNLYEELNTNRRHKKRMANAILNLFFISLLRNHAKDITLQGSNESALNNDLIYLLHYIEENFQTVTLQELSNLFNYSERQIQRVIKSSTGLTYKQLLLKIKMQHAAILLTHEELSVADITYKLGYSDVSNFRHAFKKYFNSTPSEYKIRTKGI